MERDGGSDRRIDCNTAAHDREREDHRRVIRGVDLSTLRADWIIASIQNKFTGETDELQGRYDANGKFEVTIPNGTKDEAIESFEISHSPVTNRQKLTIVSRNPWLLEGAAQPNP